MRALAVGLIFAPYVPMHGNGMPNVQGAFSGLLRLRVLEYLHHAVTIIQLNEHCNQRLLLVALAQAMLCLTPSTTSLLIRLFQTENPHSLQHFNHSSLHTRTFLQACLWIITPTTWPNDHCIIIRDASWWHEQTSSTTTTKDVLTSSNCHQLSSTYLLRCSKPQALHSCDFQKVRSSRSVCKMGRGGRNS